jgi:hypothetical protein
MILNHNTLSAYIERFNSLDEETVVSSINNDQACEWMKSQIPRLDCPDKDIEETYYFRWWTYRKHLKYTQEGHVVTEFLPDVPWAGRHHAISCASGHHLYEGRWLRDTGPLFDYVRFWYRGGGALHDYSNWIPDGLYKLCLTTGDFDPAIELLPDLVADEQNWERDHRHGSGLFWSSDDRDGGEFSISGPGLRTTLNCYLCANMRAIAAIAEKAGKAELHETFINKAGMLGRLILDRLWDEKAGFFRCVPLQDKQMPVANWSFGSMEPALVVRELWGYLPWYFDLPGRGYEKAFRALFDPDGFHGDYGPTTAERCHPLYGIFYTGGELRQWLDKRPVAVRQQIGERGHECLWNGPSWPFATSQAITALANHLAGSERPVVSSREFLQLLGRYARSHHRVREDGMVIPWIDENLHPDTGDWISRTCLKSWASGVWDRAKGGYERGKDYNHSTYCDLIISGLFGIRPLADGVEIHPLLPKSGWQYACLDGIPCRGHLLTVLYDKLGTRYAMGKGFRVLVDGAVKFSFDTPQPCRFEL